MKMQPILVLLMFATIESPPTFAKEPVSGNSLASFTFNGLPLGTSVEEVKRRFPAHEYDQETSNPKSGVVAYFVGGSKGSDGAVLSFFNGKLFKVDVYYTARRINDMGGFEAMTKRLISQFGSTDDVVFGTAGTCLTWNQTDVNRRAELRAVTTAVSFTVSDAAVEKAVNQRKAANANLGF